MVITLRLIVIDVPSGLRLFSISDKESEDEWIVSRTLEATHSLLAGKHTILDMSQ